MKSLKTKHLANLATLSGYLLGIQAGIGLFAALTLGMKSTITFYTFLTMVGFASIGVAWLIGRNMRLGFYLGAAIWSFDLLLRIGLVLAGQVQVNLVFLAAAGLSSVLLIQCIEHLLALHPVQTKAIEIANPHSRYPQETADTDYRLA